MSLDEREPDDGATQCDECTSPATQGALCDACADEHNERAVREMIEARDKALKTLRKCLDDVDEEARTYASRVGAVDRGTSYAVGWLKGGIRQAIAELAYK